MNPDEKKVTDTQKIDLKNLNSQIKELNERVQRRCSKPPSTIEEKPKEEKEQHER